MNTDYSNLIGVPYNKMNCWQLCQSFYKQVLDKTLQNYFEVQPEHRYEMKNLVKAHEGDFNKVRSPEFGDLILIKYFGIESHIAVFLGNGLFLHTTKKTGSVIDRIARYSNIISGYYSLDKGRND